MDMKLSLIVFKNAIKEFCSTSFYSLIIFAYVVHTFQYDARRTNNSNSPQPLPSLNFWS